MAPRYQQGYKPIQTRETSALDPLSVRFVRHMDDNINHTIVALSPKLVSQFWPGGRSEADSAPSTEEVDLMAIWGPFRIPEFYDKISWTIGVDSTMGAGVNVMWELYCSDTQPSFQMSSQDGRTGPLGDTWYVDAARMGNYDVDTLEEVPGAFSIMASKRGLEVRRGAETGESWLVLFARTVDDTAASLTRTATIYHLDATAQHSAAY